MNVKQVSVLLWSLMALFSADIIGTNPSQTCGCCGLQCGTGDVCRQWMTVLQRLCHPNEELHICVCEFEIVSITSENQKCSALPFPWWLKRAKLITLPGGLHWANSLATGWHRLAHQVHHYSVKACIAVINKSERKKKKKRSIFLCCAYKEKMAFG